MIQERESSKTVAIAETQLPKAKVNLTDGTCQIDSEKPMTVAEVASFLSRPQSAIYGLINKRSIPCYKRGKRVYFFKEEILAWIKKGKMSCKAEVDEMANQVIHGRKLR